MVATLRSVTYAVPRPEGAGRFWGALLGRTPTVGDDGVRVADEADTCGVGLRFVAGSTAAGASHLHVTSQAAGDQAPVVRRVLALGGRHLDVGQLPEEDHVVMTDPDGLPFCVIDPGNTYLRDCGALGEVTCDGGRPTGVFWATVLAWPLVWDADGETAVQAPAGGTKLSWSGDPRPGEPGTGPRLELTTDDVEAEVRRLVDLGAILVSRRPGWAELLDPAGGGIDLTEDPSRPHLGPT